MAIEIYANNCDTTLALALPASGVGSDTATLASGTGSIFPQPGAAQYPVGETTYFRLTFIKASDPTVTEICYCTARSGDVCTITRGQEGTSALAWNAGDIAANLDTAGAEGVQIQGTQLQSGALNYAVGGGTSTALTATLPYNFVGRLNAGMFFNVLIPSTNTGAYTFNLNSYGARQVVDKRGVDLIAGSLIGGLVYQFIYDGTRWVVEDAAVQNQVTFLDDTSKTANTVTVTTGLGITALQRSFIIYIRVANTNSGGITVQVDSATSYPAVASDGNAIQSQSVKAGGVYRFLFDGTKFYTDVTNTQSFPIGTILDFFGNPANITNLYGPGWQIADGTNGSPDLRDRTTIGAGVSYAMGAVVGSPTTTLSVANIPVHAHPINDPGHVHGINDPAHSHVLNGSGTGVYINQSPHAHGVSDPGHQHVAPWGENNGSYNPPWGSYGANNLIGSQNHDNDNCWGYVSPSGTGIGIQAQYANVSIGDPGHSHGVNVATTGISIRAVATGVTVGNTGSGAAFDNHQPSVAVYKIIRMS